MPIIPIKIQNNQIISNGECENLTFKELKLKECHIEEFVKENIGNLFNEEENLLIVGQQVIDSTNSRSDLVAIDDEGSLVLIEIKRDADDIKSRSETLESQAIRYASSLAKIKSRQELSEKMFSGYIQKHIHKNGEAKSLSSFELAERELKSFISNNQISESSFNKKQRIILIASEFDQNTLSSAAWLSRSGIDFSCYELRPAKINQQYVVKFERILPLDHEEEYFIDIKPSESGFYHPSKKDKTSTRRQLPRMNILFEWGLIKPGMTLHFKNYPGCEAKAIDEKTVEFKGKQMSYNRWGQEVTKWSAICIYDWIVPENGSKTLNELRNEKMIQVSKTAA